MDTSPQSPARKIIGLEAFALPDEVLLLYKEQIGDQTLLHTAASQNGSEIHTHKDHPVIVDLEGKEILPDQLIECKISRTDEQFVLCFQKKDDPQIYIATSTDALQWKVIGLSQTLKSPGVIVQTIRANGKYIMYFGASDLFVAYSSDLINWEVVPTPVLRHFEDQFGPMHLSVGTVLLTQQGILLIFLAKGMIGLNPDYSLHAVFLDRTAPQTVLRRSETLWEQTQEWSGRDVKPIGIAYFQRKLISYWDFNDEGMFAITHTSLKTHTTVQPSIRATDLQRLTQNPLLNPVSAHYWESKAVFNPAAIVEDGKVHLLYRAIGDNDVSVLGYAASSNGIEFDQRLKEPAYIPRASFEGATDRPIDPTLIALGSDLYLSGGGGMGGVEDPRLTKIDDKFYLTYVAYDGWSPPRVALSSISVQDFMNKVWNWAEPVLISPPGVVDKNAVIFPEKINGKYVVLHRIFPNILVDFVDSLDDFDGNTFLKGEYAIRPSRTGWDNRKIGAGAPPIKTKDGWLLIYHSVGESDPGKYKMGAMLLDLNDPTKVLYRTVVPILAPDAPEENEGFKAGVAYPCGAVVIDNTLYVYYGGADTVICAATANLDEFLAELKDSGKVHMTPVSVHTRHKML